MPATTKSIATVKSCSEMTVKNLAPLNTKRRSLGSNSMKSHQSPTVKSIKKNHALFIHIPKIEKSSSYLEIAWSL